MPHALRVMQHGSQSGQTAKPITITDCGQLS